MMHQKRKHHMDVSKNRGTPKSSILKGFFIINHPFWGPTPIFGNIHILIATLFSSAQESFGSWGAMGFSSWVCDSMMVILCLGIPRRKMFFERPWYWKRHPRFFMDGRKAGCLSAYAVPGDQVLFARAICLIWMTKRVNPIAWISLGAPFVAFQEAVTSSETRWKQPLSIVLVCLFPVPCWVVLLLAA